MPSTVDSLTETMFRAVASGRSYKVMAHCHGVCRSAVHQRVMRLARHLQLFVGVEGVDDQTTPSLELVRQHCDQYLAALGIYDPSRLVNRQAIVQAVMVVDIAAMLAGIERRSQRRNRLRDKALMLLLFGVGLKPCEMVGLAVKDYLNPDGSVKMESSLSKSLAHNGKARALYFSSPLVRESIDNYLEDRRQHAPGAPFRGLDPRSALMLRADGAAFSRRLRDVHALQHCLRGVLQRAGCDGYNTSWARSRLAQRLSALGLPNSEVAAVLGVQARELRPLFASAQERRSGTVATPPVVQAMALLP